MSSTWYSVANADEIDSPALLIYPDRVAENLRRIVKIARGTERLRPHVKTHKLPQIVRMQLEAGITRFKCATIAEAEMVAECGAPDVMLGYPILGPAVPRFVHLLKRFPDTAFSVLADDEPSLRRLSDAVSGAGQMVAVLLDIDNGMHRTGIAPGDGAKRLYRLIAELPGLQPGGLHVYDGHIKEPDFSRRVAAAEAAFESVENLRHELLRAELSVPRVVCGGTPTFPVHALHPDRELSPGTCVLWDESYATKLPDLDFQFSALLLTRVISKPGPDRICVDLGYKAVSPDNPDPRARFLDLPDAVMTVHSEEHLALATSRAGELAVGDVLYAVPYHVCPTCALHREAWVVEQGVARHRWPIVARERRLTI